MDLEAMSQHLSILAGRASRQARRITAAQANARAPAPRIPPMTMESRLLGYVRTPGRYDARRPTGRQLRRAMRKAGALDAGAVLAAWDDVRDIIHMAGYECGFVIWDEPNRLA